MMALRITSLAHLLHWARVRLKYILLTIIIFFTIEYFGVFTHLFEVDYSKFAYPLDVPIEDVLLDFQNDKLPSYKPINQYDYSFIIKNEKKCYKKDSEDYEKVVILYVVKSAMNNQNNRDAIRRTWGWERRFYDVVIKTVFVVGISETDDEIQAKINAEHFKNGDMVQANFIDSYYNNTIKTMMSFQWVIQNCPKAQFIVFSDDDMYISTKNMLKFIRNPFNKRVGFRRRRDIEAIVSKQAVKSHVKYNESKETNFPTRKLFDDPILSAFDGRLFAGFVFNSSPMRHKASKWYVTLKEYPFSRYPPYVTAGAFVLSYPALLDLYYTSMFTKHFKFDDVYLGIVAKKCNIVPLHNEHFHFWKKAYDKVGYANVIASHGYDDPNELIFAWEEQRSLGHA